MLVKDNIEIIAVRDDLKLQNSGQTYRIENMLIECRISGSKTNVIVVVIYRHPNFNIGDFTKDVETTLQAIHRENKISFICGDFNINV